MHDALVDIDARETGSMNIESDRAQLISLFRAVKQIGDKDRRDDCDQKSYIDICSSQRLLQKRMLRQKSLPRSASDRFHAGSTIV